MNDRPYQLIPYQLTEENFRKYEPFITRAVNAWPQETEFVRDEMKDAKGLISPHTFAARMRDAILSFKRYSWTPTTIDIPKLQAMTGQFSIAFGEGGSVWWKAKGKRGRPPTDPQKARAQGFAIDADVDRKPWKEVTEDEVRAVALLLDKGRLTGPIVFDGLLPHETKETIEAEFNVVLTWDHENRKTIISA